MPNPTSTHSAPPPTALAGPWRVRTAASDGPGLQDVGEPGADVGRRLALWLADVAAEATESAPVDESNRGSRSGPR
jgi:hypothetical protein